MEPKNSDIKSNDAKYNSRNYTRSLGYRNIGSREVFSRCTMSKFAVKRIDSVVKVEANLVTSKNVEINSPHISEVTKKQTEPNGKRWQPVFKTFSIYSLILLLFCANAFILQMETEECKKCSQEIIELQRVLLETTKQIYNLSQTIKDVSWNYRLRTDVNSKLQRDVAAGKRFKRSDEETSRWDQIRSRDTVAIQFSGSKPFGFSAVPSKGILSPWAESTHDYSIVEEFGARLNDGNSTLEINQDGWYMIYAQVTYLQFVNSNSYSIQVIPKADKAHVQTITTCSSSEKITKIGEISCYTSAVKKFHAGDVVYIQQAQPNREIVFSKTYTYFGLIVLN